MTEFPDTVEIDHQGPVGIEVLRLDTIECQRALQQGGKNPNLCSGHGWQAGREYTAVETPWRIAGLARKKGIARLQALGRKQTTIPATIQSPDLFRRARDRRR